MTARCTTEAKSVCKGSKSKQLARHQTPVYLKLLLTVATNSPFLYFSPFTLPY